MSLSMRMFENKFRQTNYLSARWNYLCMLLVSLTMMSASFTASSTELDSVTLEYRVRLEGIIADVTAGKIQTELTRNKNGYSVTTVTKAQGMAATFLGTNIQENCEFDIVDGRAVPVTYTGGTIKQQDYQVTYDWDNRKIKFQDDESLDMPQGYIIDNCVMPFAISILKGVAPANDVIYVVDGKKRRIRGYKVRSTEAEEIDTPVGTLSTTKIVLEREFRPQRTFTFWLSDANQYLPVKMQEKRKSRTTTMTVRNMEFIN